MDTVTVSAPGKLMLMGEHAVLHGYPCIVTAVGQRMKAIVRRIPARMLQLDAKDVGITGYAKSFDALGNGEIPRGAAFIERAMHNILEDYPLDAGVHVETISQFSAQFGFGSSSASTVCVVKAVSELFGLGMSKKDVFDVAYKTVMDVQGKGSGFDIAAAIYGGTLYFVKGEKVIEPIAAADLPLIIGYTGTKADTVTLINQVKKKSEENTAFIDDIYAQIGDLVERGKEVMIQRDWKTYGSLMDRDQELLASLGVSSARLDGMIAAARRAGAWGAKLSGAGGGDCMIAFAPEEKRKAVEEAITTAGGQVLDVPGNAEGVRIE